jgi:hypothetical protein
MHFIPAELEHLHQEHLGDAVPADSGQSDLLASAGQAHPAVRFVLHQPLLTQAGDQARHCLAGGAHLFCQDRQANVGRLFLHAVNFGGIPPHGWGNHCQKMINQG